MYVSITGNKGNQDVYIKQSYRKDNGKTSSRIYKKLGKYNDLLARFSGNEAAMMDWAKKEAEKETLLYNQRREKVTVSFSPLARIPLDEERLFNVGYLFLQQLCTELRLDNICRNIRNHHRFTYDFHAILTDLIYARILSPSSKLSSFSYCQSLLEAPKYSLQNLYRSISVLAEESDYIQEELYQNSNFIHPRNSKILYYDCTNYYFEIEAEDGMKKYGKSKEHRPNPIVTMGLFMDADGIPLSFDLYSGNQNEQLTLKPLETKVIRDFNCSEFIFCSDAGLGSKGNRFFNSFGNRSYVITYSLKKMKKEERELALLPTQFRVPGSDKFIDISTLDETKYITPFITKNTPLSREIWTKLLSSHTPRNTRHTSRGSGLVRSNVPSGSCSPRIKPGKEKILTILPVSFRKQQLPVTERSHRNRFFSWMKSVSGKKPCMTVSMQW